MEHLKPLIESGAYWLQTDAMLRIAWTIFGMALIGLGLVVFGLLLGKFLNSGQSK